MRYDVVKGSCGGVFGFEAVLCMMLWDVVVMYGRRAFSRVPVVRTLAAVCCFHEQDPSLHCYPMHWPFKVLSF